MGCVGEQLIAPKGHRSLSAENIYIYLGRVGRDAEALLCSLDHIDREVHLEYLSARAFEAAIASNALIPRSPQYSLPDWLSEAVKRSDDPSDSFSLKNYKKREKTHVKKRYKKIKELLKSTRKHRILNAPDPKKVVRKHARGNGYNEKRTVFDFFSVIAYSTSKWALLSTRFRNGSYERTDNDDAKKVGPKHQYKGENYGWARGKKMTEKILRAYDKYCGLGVSMSKIYRQAMIADFKCKVRRKSQSRREFYHPKGRPFPTLRQFETAVLSEHGHDKVYQDKHGEQHTRKRRRPDKGAFSESVANILERTEADGYFVEEIPKGERDGHPMPPLCVVRIRDLLSGILGGIGFSIGGETADAYRMALFCMAIKKSLFGRLMGVPIDDSDWPIVGLPAWFSVDRGPGACKELLDDLSESVIFRDMAPSYAGQSKASVESTNPRTVTASGPPRYVQSDLTYTQLAQREILRTVGQCVRMDVSSRLTPEMIDAGVEANPLALFNHLSAMYRNVAQQMPFEDAIRTFLPKQSAKATSRGVSLFKQPYVSTAVEQSGLLDRTVRAGTLDIPAYAIPLCARQIWLDVDGSLIECQAALKIRDDDRQLYLSIDDLIRLDELRRAAAQADKESRMAIDAEFEQVFEELTGKDWDGGNVTARRPRTKSAASTAEFSDTKATIAAKK